MEEMKTCKINGITYLDPTGDLSRIMLVMHTLKIILEDMFRCWSFATCIDDVTMRRSSMETLRDSIDRMTHCILKLDNVLDLAMKEVYHETD